jgi:plasmid stabilization system protein ParE
MRLRAVLRPEAEADLRRARDWYDREGAQLGEAFLQAFADIIDRIVGMPELYVVAFKNIRRGKMRKFPYLVYYRLLSDRIEVIGVLHGSRDLRLLHQRAE